MHGLNQKAQGVLPPALIFQCFTSYLITPICELISFESSEYCFIELDCPCWVEGGTKAQYYRRQSS